MTLKEQLKAKLDARAALVKTAIDASRAMTEEEQTKYNDLGKEIVSLEATIKAAEEEEKRQIAAKTPGQGQDPLYADPKDHKPIWKGFGEFLFAVKNAASPERVMDKRLTVMDAASGASEGVPSDGGFLVETQTTTELLKDTYETAVLAPKCKKVPIGPGKNGLKLNMIDESSRADGSRQGGVLAYWEGEADALVDSKPKFGILELNLKKLTGLYYATDELLQDATALESVVTGFFGEEFGFKLDDAILRGTGAGMPLGILNSPVLITVAKTAAQTADTITFNNILDMWSRCRARNRMNAAWFVNQEVETQLAKLSFTIGTEGVPVFLPAGGASVNGYSTLFGRPIIPIEQAAALGDKGDIMLFDLSEYLLIDKGGINAASSIHVRFLYDESVFRFIYRVDGQPKRKKPLTPYKGSNTLSPFIVLAERA